MTEIERLRHAIKIAANRKNLGTNKKIAEYLGYGAPYLSSLLNGNEALSEKFLSHVCDKLDISRDFVKSGSGEVLRERYSQSNNVNGNNNTTSNSISVSTSTLFELLNGKIDKLQTQNQEIINLLNKLLIGKDESK